MDDIIFLPCPTVLEFYDEPLKVRLRGKCSNFVSSPVPGDEYKFKNKFMNPMADRPKQYQYIDSLAKIHV